MRIHHKNDHESSIESCEEGIFGVFFVFFINEFLKDIESSENKLPCKSEDSENISIS